ncbi:MAG: flagellar motor protein MotB [Rhodospirillales bacterium]
MSSKKRKELSTNWLVIFADLVALMLTFFCNAIFNLKRYTGKLERNGRCAY